ncbi:MAG: hypothetical protein Q8K60_08180 [Parachlamydiaceae bacterium]|nr:hypothetical protein [Parachlamydiaceae bacterium]
MVTPNPTPHVHDDACSTREGLCRTEDLCRKPSYQAYKLLKIAFTLLAVFVGLDKFFNNFAVWELYLSAPFNFLGDPLKTMMVVGVIEIIVGIGIWFKPKIFAYVVAIWLFAIIINLILLGNFYDIALRDFALALSALALGRLSEKYDCCGASCHNPKHHHTPTNNPPKV